MKILIILSLLFFKQMSCENISASFPGRSECERENHQLRFEVDQLKMENANLKHKLHQMSEGNLEAMPKVKRYTLMNCSALSIEVSDLSQNFVDLSAELKDFNTTYWKELTESDDETRASYMNCDDLKSNEGSFSNNFGMLSDDVNKFKSLWRKVEETVCDCMPKKFSGSKFISPSLYEKVCDFKKSNGEWTLIQRRVDGSESFYRSWADYKAGFRNKNGNFFIGLDNLHQLTTCAHQELLIETTDFNNRNSFATYSLFEVGDESEKYKLKEIEGYSGNLVDRLSAHKSKKFTTFDQDNDEWSGGNCAREHKGAWWYISCHNCDWNSDYGNASFKKVVIKIRPKN